MFLVLVFLAELVAGISGFIFRHEVIHCFIFLLYIQYFRYHLLSSLLMFSLFFLKIKAVLQGVYNKAQLVYSGKGNEDLDRIQRTVSMYLFYWEQYKTSELYQTSLICLNVIMRNVIDIFCHL